MDKKGKHNLTVVGLTGGIATGKSTVAEFFREAGAAVLDVDAIARDVVKKGFPAWHGIVEHFGKEVLLPDSEINRSHLGELIFKNQDDKQILNSIVHPFIMKEMKKRFNHMRQQMPGGIVIFNAPLIESGKYRGMAHVVVVYLSEDLQIQRLMERERISKPDAMARIRSQMPIEEKKTYASLLIDNSCSKAETKAKTLRIYRDLKKTKEDVSL